MTNTELKEDDIVMCTVKKIEGTTVFVDIEGNGSGSIVFTEVAAGRIRNLREYVIPNKKIVCKVLKIDPSEHIHLSLRRVTAKERDEVKERYQKELTFSKLLKATIKDAEKIIEKIKKEFSLADFIDAVKEDIKILERFIPEDKIVEITKILTEKKAKEKTSKHIILLKSLSSSGINDIKSILALIKDIKIVYLGSSKFSISATSSNFKDANHKVLAAIEQIKAKAKEKHVLFEMSEAKIKK